jgi:hypothetical protein
MAYREHKGDRFRGWVRADFAPPPEILESPEEIRRLPGAEHLLDCQGRQIYRVPLIVGGQPASCFTYHFTNGSWPRSLRRSYAYRTLRVSRRMERAGFPALEALAALKRRGEILNWTGLLVAREILDVAELPSQGSHVFQIHRFAPLSQAVAEGLGRYLARFHRQGFFHGDLKARHVLARIAQAEPQFYLVDLEKTICSPRAPELVRLVLGSRDLAQLLASLPDDGAGEFRVRLLEAYLPDSPLSARNRARMRRILGMYGDGGAFRQGSTLAANLWRLARSRRRERGQVKKQPD